LFTKNGARMGPLTLEFGMQADSPLPTSTFWPSYRRGGEEREAKVVLPPAAHRRDQDQGPTDPAGANPPTPARTGRDCVRFFAQQRRISTGGD